MQAEKVLQALSMEETAWKLFARNRKITDFVRLMVLDMLKFMPQETAINLLASMDDADSLLIQLDKIARERPRFKAGKLDTEGMAKWTAELKKITSPWKDKIADVMAQLTVIRNLYNCRQYQTQASCKQNKVPWALRGEEEKRDVNNPPSICSWTPVIGCHRPFRERSYLPAKPFSLDEYCASSSDDDHRCRAKLVCSPSWLRSKCVPSSDPGNLLKQYLRTGIMQELAKAQLRRAGTVAPMVPGMQRKEFREELNLPGGNLPSPLPRAEEEEEEEFNPS